MEVLTIYYDDNINLFKDEDGIEFEITSIMSNDDIIYYKKVGGTYSIVKSDDIVYEVDFPFNNGYNRILIYWKEDNLFTDEEGQIIFNIFSLITPNDLYLFKKNKDNATIDGLQGGVIDIVYSEYKSLSSFYR